MKTYLNIESYFSYCCCSFIVIRSARKKKLERNQNLCFSSGCLFGQRLAETLQLFLFLFSLQHIKRPALQNKQFVVLRMAFRARKVLGNSEKRAPGSLSAKQIYPRMHWGFSITRLLFLSHCLPRIVFGRICVEF